MLERLRSDPLRGLIGLEWFAVVSSYAFDVSVAVWHINRNGDAPRSVAVFTLLFVATAVGVLSLPHAPHRRYAVLTVSVLGLAGLGLWPTSTTATFILLLVFGTRLTFAFGFRGTVFAWASAIAVVVLGDASDVVGRPVAMVVEDVEWGVVLTLLFGLVGIMWLYANKAATAAATSERSRIALDLHDSLGHALTTLSVHLQNAIQLRDVDARKASGYLDRASALAQDALDDVRETVAILHDDRAARPLAVAALLERLRSDFAAAHSMTLHWNVRLTSQPEGRTAVVVYRVLQEALTNVARHAGARNVSVAVSGDTSRIDLEVVDDGCGFPASTDAGHGLTSMRSRVESLDGVFRVDSRVGAGTVLQATIPTGRAS